MKSIYTIILHYSNFQNTVDCIKSCLKVRKDGLSLKILLVNNNPQEKLEKKIESQFREVEIIENSKNYGFAKGNNIGIRNALKKGADYFLLLNNDTVVSKDFLIQLIKAFKENKQISIASPKIYFAPGFEFHKERYSEKEKGKVIWYAGGKIDWKNIYASHVGVNKVDKDQFNSLGPTDFATGCCMFIKKQVFEKTGLFDHKYFLYWEDVDFCQRAKKQGFQVFYCPQSHIYHKNAESSFVGSQLQDYYQTRNRLLFGLKYGSVKVKISLVKQSMQRLFKGRQWEKKGIVDFYTRNFGRGRFKNS
ncbi:glycosyltransferase family 2 protein [Patescibacteria group bacterium]